jgi:hypothetical protein
VGLTRWLDNPTVAIPDRNRPFAERTVKRVRRNWCANVTDHTFLSGGDPEGDSGMTAFPYWPGSASGPAWTRDSSAIKSSTAAFARMLASPFRALSRRSSASWSCT